MRRLGVAAIALLLGCGGDTSGPTPARVVIGVIDLGSSLDSALVGPTAGAVGEPLTYRVTTFGNGCMTSAGAQVINQGLQMTVVPYDSVAPGPCPDILRSIPREVMIVFDRSGDAVLRLQGQSWVGKNPVVLTRPLQIRP